MALEPVDDALLAGHLERLWELFHENSKQTFLERHATFALHPSDDAVVRVMNGLRRVKPYTDRPKLALPDAWPAAGAGLDSVMRDRVSARAFSGEEVDLARLAKLLWMSYGVTRDNEGTDFPRPFRTVPSGGALYPLELYVCAARVGGLEPGLYHYDPEDHSLDVLRLGAVHDDLSRLLVQRELALSCAAIVLVSAVFLRSTFKYGDRGYRFVLLEAGHLGQNAILCAEGVGLRAVPVGGYLDRDVDRYLGFDGLSESTVYMLLIGPPPGERADAR